MANEWTKMFNDPISLEPMKDPVIASDGHTYDYASLCQWMEHNPHRLSPITKEVLRPHVYSNLQMLEFLRMKQPNKPPCRRIYSRIHCREMMVPLDGTQPKIPWIVRFLTRTRWRRKALSLITPVTTNEGKWEAVGPPVAFPFEDAMKDWVHDFGLDMLVSNPLCLSMARLSVDGNVQGTLEEICGSDLAESCRAPTS